MSKQFEGEYEEILENFDAIELDNITSKRMAQQVLYDYFQKLTLEIGISIGLNKEMLQGGHLNSRWITLKRCLNSITQTQDWDSLIEKMVKIRNATSHIDYFIPQSSELKKIREEAPKFKEWIIKFAKEYYKKSKNFTFKEKFYLFSQNYISVAEMIFKDYGEDYPLESKLDIFPEPISRIPYHELKKYVKYLNQRLKELAKLDEITRDDLEKLIAIVETTAFIKGREEISLQSSKCPRCGGEIKETEAPIGSNDEYAQGIYYRVGCENCNYVIHEDTVDLP